MAKTLTLEGLDPHDTETVISKSIVENRVVSVEKPVAGSQTWHLQYKEGRSGPFSVTEVEAILKFHKIAPPIYCWRPGMKEWAPIDQIPEFSKSGKEIKSLNVPKNAPPQRKHKRGALLATVKLVGDQTQTVGICRNISAGGMQVLGFAPPSGVGTEFEIQVFPNQGFKVPPFEVKIKVIRLLTARPGFAVQFLDLADFIREAIEAHLGS